MALVPSYLDQYDINIFGSIKGVIGMEGIYDIPLFVKDYPETKDDFISLAFGDNETEWKLASPYYYTRKEASSIGYLVIHSLQDGL